MNEQQDTMKLGQVIVSSGGAESGYRNKLISRSQDIDDPTVEKLLQWSPDRNGLALGRTESLNFIQLDPDRFALSRSVIGGLECRRNRGRRIVSNTVVVRREQFEGYQNNAVWLAQVLLSMGSLILHTDDSRELPPLEVPERSFDWPDFQPTPNPSVDYDRVAHAIDVHGNVVILGLSEPLDFLSGLLNATEASKRLDISFATGLQVEDDRAFTLQFFADPDPVLSQELARRQHRTISLKSEQVLN